MRELWEILQRIAELVDQGEPAALATVIATSGSTYRRPGARMLVTPVGAIGAVSAGCLEDEIIAVGKRVIQTGKLQRLRFDTTEELDVVAGTGLGCRGMIDVLIAPLDAERVDIYLKLGQLLEEDRLCTLVVETKAGKHALLAQEELQLGELSDPELLKGVQRVAETLSARRPTALFRHGEREVYVERLEPPLKLVVCGAGYDAPPLVKFAKELGFRVTVVDPRPAYLTRERFPWADQLVLAHPREVAEKLHVDERTFIVIMTHNYARDLELLKWALWTRAPYVGQIGPRARTQELLADLEKEQGPPPPEAREKLHAPVGLDLGAETPEEIALSVLSEIVAVRNGRAGGFLRERKGSIHAHEPR